MALSLDGSVQTNFNAGSGASGTLTTTTGSGVIVAAIITNAASVTNVTGSGLTFTQRTSNSNGGNTSSHWTAPYTSNFSGTLSITLSGSAFTTVTAFGIGGANTSSPFDGNGAIPASSGAAALVSATTSNANDFIFANYLTAIASEAVGAGWTQISSGNFQFVEYQIVSATQSGLQATMAAGHTGQSGTLDAIVQAGGGATFLAAWARGSNLPVIGTGTY